MVHELTARRLGALLLGVMLLGAGSVQADTLARRQNIVDLIEHADIILHGDVVEVTDGVENNIPYTQVKVRVRETIRGGISGVYTFRQFGLLAPRALGNGMVSYMVTPAGWAAYRPNEEVILFLYKPARKTGLRTTVGLGQGKFGIRGGLATSQEGNRGLFEDVAIDDGLLDKHESRVLAKTNGPVDAGAFLSFVRRAVDDQWIERSKMRHAK